MIFYGERIRQARILRWKSSIEVAEILGWSPSRLTKAEQSTTVDVSEAESLALLKGLRFPKLFFEREPPAGLGETDLLFRAPKRTTRREKKYLVEFARTVDELAADLDARHRLPAVRVPVFTDRVPRIAEASRSARAALKIEPGEPISHLTHVLERSGVVVVVRPRGLSPLESDNFGDEGNRYSEVHHGYSAWVGEYQDRSIVVTRASTSWERTRWTLAHELGHLVLHRNSVPEGAEDEASRFASEFLAPIDSLPNEVPKHVTLSGLVNLKMKWGISLGALITHLHAGDLISDERYQALRNQLYARMNPETGRTWGLDEPGWDKYEPERPRMLAAWSERCFGTSDADRLAPLVAIFPRDLLNQIYATQRGAGDRSLKPIALAPKIEDNVRSVDFGRRSSIGKS